MNRQERMNKRITIAATIFLIIILFILFVDIDNLKDKIVYAGENISEKVIDSILGNMNNVKAYTKKNENKEDVSLLAIVLSSLRQDGVYAYVGDNVELTTFSQKYPYDSILGYKSAKEKETNANDKNNTKPEETTKQDNVETEANTENNTGEKETQGEGDDAKAVIQIPDKVGEEFPIAKLNDFDFLISKLYTVDSSTTVTSSDLNASELLEKDMTMKQDNSKPQILIYHTHSQEAFADSVPGDVSTTIVGVGDYLTKLLTEKYGYNVIHCKETFDLVNGVVTRNNAYNRAIPVLQQILADNPSIEVVIDLHRDGVNDSLHFATEINGKPTAKVMFFNGLSRLNGIGEVDYLYNKYRSDNLAMSLQMKLKAMAYYPDFTRKNYLNGYLYNMKLRAKTMLIEAGAQTNTVEEEMNAMEPLAMLLYMVLQ